MHLLRTSSLLLLALLPGAVYAQTVDSPKLDLAVSYIAQRSLKANTDQNFWFQGGSIELGANLWKGWGIAADVTGSHSNAIGASGGPISLVTETFGPRYRWHAQKKISVYGQVLAGEANGFGSLFPTPSGSQPDANSLALQIGGGLDYRPKRHLAVRVLDGAWLRTQLPNSTDNVQNNLRLGAGLVIFFGR